MNESVKFFEISCCPGDMKDMLSTMRRIFSIFPNLLNVKVSVNIDVDKNAVSS